jgi:hypothetical protein
MFMRDTEFKVDRLKKLTSEYYYRLIKELVYSYSLDEKLSFYPLRISDDLSKKVCQSIVDLENLESSRENLNAPDSKEVINALENRIQKQQDIFEKDVLSLQDALNEYLLKNPKDESTKKLKQKIEAIRGLKATLDSKKEGGEKLNDFHKQLIQENRILRQHRNKHWDRFYNVVLLPFAPLISIYNRIEYGTWNLKVTNGDEMVTKANEVIAETNKRNSF